MFPILLPLALAQMPNQNAAPTDRDKAGLRGAVKTATTENEQELGGRTVLSTSTVEYTPDGRVVSESRKLGEGPEWISIKKYGPTGLLVESIFGSSDVPFADRQRIVYTHHEDGRTEARSGHDLHVVSRIDDLGRRVDIEYFPDISDRPNVAVASPRWFDSGLGLPAPSGGRFETIYNQRGLPLEGHTYEPNGKETARVLRTNDDRDRPIRDEVTAYPVTLAFPSEFTDHLNPEQLQSAAAWWSSQFNGHTTYKYDSYGLLVERKMSGNMRGETISVFEYNQQGDKTLEHTTSTESSTFGMEFGLTKDGQMIPDRKVPLPPPQISETRYDYVYDSHGNWTEQRIKASYSVQSAPVPEQVIRRTLTYYDDTK